MQRRAPDVLVSADGAAALPRLGGMARPGGVVIVSERFWAFAGRDGRLHECAMPRPLRIGRRIPLLRGLLRLFASLAPLFRAGGTARRGERLLLLTALAAPFAFAFLPASFEIAGAVVTTVALVAMLFRGRTLALHGAEHRAIAAAEARSLRATWAGSVRPSRFSPRCGTNFAALALPVTVAVQELWPLAFAFYTPLILVVLSLALTMELWQAVQSSGSRLLRLLLVPGLALQRVTTREPALGETRVALLAVASVLRRELAVD